MGAHPRPVLGRRPVLHVDSQDDERTRRPPRPEDRESRRRADLLAGGDARARGDAVHRREGQAPGHPVLIAVLHPVDARSREHHRHSCRKHLPLRWRREGR